MSSSTSPMSPSTARSTQPPPSFPTSSSTSNQLYTLASRVPLIKSHSISIPKPVKLPPDLHPLPTDISAYFVYPFSLESYVLDPNTPSSSTVEQLLEKHKLYLEAREREKEEKKRELLRKMAPGWQGGAGAVLMPTSASQQLVAEKEAGVEGKGGDGQVGEQHGQKEERTPLDDLADHLAQLDALNSSAHGPPPSFNYLS